MECGGVNYSNGDFRFCLFVCRFTDSGGSGSVALLRMHMEPALPKGSRPPRAGRCGEGRDSAKHTDTGTHAQMRIQCIQEQLYEYLDLDPQCPECS